MSIFDIFKKLDEKKAARGAPSFLVVGLGNPGRQYAKNRHNAGFDAVDFIAGKLGVKINKAKFNALIADCDISDRRVILMKPQTFMNASGTAVSDAAEFYKIPPENVIVLCDDVSFDPGKIRVRRDGSSGGHNGLKSIGTWLSSENYPRIKIGVGKKPAEYDLADFVLSDLPNDDAKKIAERFPDIFSAVELIISGDIEKAMQICN